MSRFDEIYDDLVMSIEKYVVDKRSLLLSEYPTLTYFDWDTVAETHELPDADLIGPAGLGLIEQQAGVFELVGAIGLATCNDPSLARLRRMVSKVFADFRPMKTLAVYRNEGVTSGSVPMSWAVMQAGSGITPISKSASRPRQFIEFSALLDPSAPRRS